jgi:hypothetical protein
MWRAEVRPSMRTLGGEVLRGRWGRSLFVGSPREPLESYEVAVFECCTASAFAVRMSCQMTTLNPITETTSPARLIQSPTVISTRSSTENLENGSATFVLFLGDTTWGAERDLGARSVLLRLAISQPPISQTGDVALPPPIIDGRHSPPVRSEPGNAGSGQSGAAAFSLSADELRRPATVVGWVSSPSAGMADPVRLTR